MASVEQRDINGGDWWDEANIDFILFMSVLTKEPWPRPASRWDFEMDSSWEKKIWSKSSTPEGSKLPNHSCQKELEPMLTAKHIIFIYTC